MTQNQAEFIEKTEFVDSNERLAQLCVQWSQQACLAVDTEFLRTDTFYPILGLIQVSDGEQCWLVDPLEVDQLEPFADLLKNQQVVKIFHACSEDLEVLRHALGVVPSPIVDTQVAAAFVGFGFSKGYAALVGDVLGIELDKHETRSDWLKRPLSDSQCRYAAEDVFYLVQVYHHIQQKLQESGRLSWVQQDMAALTDAAGRDINPNSYYLKIKGGWQLKRDELAILQALAAWRELTAREKDKPRSRVVNDRLLWEIARCKPKSHANLSRVPEMHPRVQRQYGDKLISLIAEILASDTEHWPQKLPKPLPREAGLLLKRMRAVLEAIAKELGVAKEVLARKKDLESITYTAMDGAAKVPNIWQGSWRSELLEGPLLGALSDL